MDSLGNKLDNIINLSNQDTHDSDFQQKYIFGNILEDNISKTFGQQPGHLSFDQCINKANISGAICNTENNGKPCQYFAFKNLNDNMNCGDKNNEQCGICWVGGSNNDEIMFTDEKGIPVYITPDNAKETIFNRELRNTNSQIDKINDEIEKNKEKLDKLNIYHIQLENNISKKNAALQYENDQNKQNNLLKILGQKINNITNYLHQEKEKEKDLTDENINNNFDKINKLDTNILTLNRLISHNTQNYISNNKTASLLYFILFLLTIAIITTFIYKMYF